VAKEEIIHAIKIPENKRMQINLKYLEKNESIEAYKDIYEIE